MESLGIGLQGFFEAVVSDPLGFLSMHPLLQFQRDGVGLEPGQLLGAHPPFCTEESAEGVDLAAFSTNERRRFLAHLAAHWGMCQTVARSCLSSSSKSSPALARQRCGLPQETETVNHKSSST